MIKTKKQMFLVIGVFTLVMMLTTVTYAFFNYTRTGVSNTIKVGRISFVTRELDTINLTNVFPISSSEATGENPNYDEVVIEIVGDTDYSGGIEYLVSAVDANIYTNQGQVVPISLDIKIDDDLGTENNNYFVARDNTNTSIYKKIVGDTLVGDQMLLVGYIAPNSVSGTPDGIDATVAIKAYLDKDKILISDTYDGTESDNMGTPNRVAQGKTVLTTSEWSALQQSGVSFKVKVEANEGIWVTGSLEEIMRTRAVMDNVSSTYVSASTGIDFGAIGSDTNGKGVYERAGTENDEYPIYYYRGDVSDNNVKFANKCWQMVRTTDTGGIKLIYNGTPGVVYEKIKLAEVSYTPNTTNTDSRWTFDSSDNTWNIEITDNSKPAIEFTVPAGDNYRLVMTGTSGSSCGGQYIFYKNGSNVYSDANGGGASMNLAYDFGTLTATDIIKMNYNGTSSSTCAVTFKLYMIGQGDLMTTNGCSIKAADKNISVVVNETSQNMFEFSGANMNNSLAYNGYMYGTVYTWDNSNWTSGARFGSNFTWDGANYKLVDATLTSPDASHHYSCNQVDPNATCTDLRYVYYGTNAKYYITLTGGDGIEQAIKKMQVNTNDSNAKNVIDTWYASNLTNYTNKLEDTIWCNDRSFGDGNNNGWNPNGGDLSTYLFYGAWERSAQASSTSTVKNQPSLLCVNKNDRFTVNNKNGNAALIYPVALLTEDEIVLAGGFAKNAYRSDLSYLATDNPYWTLSPSGFYYSESGIFITINDGGLSSYRASSTYGLRPSISLKPGTPVVRGLGTESNPYVIE